MVKPKQQVACSEMARKLTSASSVRIVMGEIQLLMAVMRQNSRWAHFDSGTPAGTDSALWKGFKVLLAAQESLRVL